MDLCDRESWRTIRRRRAAPDGDRHQRRTQLTPPTHKHPHQNLRTPPNLRGQLTARGKDPLSARYTIPQSYRMGRPGWEIDLETALHMRADATHFHLDGTLTARENGSEVRQRRWQETLPRLLF